MGPPERRGFAMVSAFPMRLTMLQGWTKRWLSGSGIKRWLVVGFGFTTMDESEAKFLIIRAFDDVWQCSLFTDSSLPSDQDETATAVTAGASGATLPSPGERDKSLCGSDQVHLLSPANANCFQDVHHRLRFCLPEPPGAHSEPEFEQQKHPSILGRPVPI
jgi:hypothetical protein